MTLTVTESDVLMKRWMSFESFSKLSSRDDRRYQSTCHIIARVPQDALRLKRLCHRKAQIDSETSFAGDAGCDKVKSMSTDHIAIVNTDYFDTFLQKPYL